MNNNQKATKRALLTSVMALVMCVVMLVGTTFAWFTDTASTGVNKIQAGNLDVQLLDATTGNSIEGETLQFKKAAGATQGEQVLWEPGCTYELPAFKVKNNGSLNLKYKIVISGIKGSAKLNEAIEWTMTDGGTPVNINGGAEVSLAPNATSGNIIIKGHMKEEAGNEYQGLSIDGIAITVYATQKDAEFDSFNNSYDAGATYPVEIIPAVNAGMTVSTKNDEGKVTSYSYANSDNTMKATYTPTTPAEATAAAPTIVVKPTSKDAGNVTINAATQDAVAYDVSLKDASGNPFNGAGSTTVELFIGKGLSNVTVYHNDAAMTGATYDSTTGYVTFATDSFSPFTIVFDSPVAVADGVSYYDLQSALNAGGKVILLKDVNVADTLIVEKTVKLDMNGKKLSNTTDIWDESRGNWSLISVRGTSGNLTVTGDGTFEARENDCYAIDLYDNTAKCTIENGTFVGNLHAVYVYEGELAVKGGSFTIKQLNTTNPYGFVLNCYDASYREGTAKITVTGGKFFNYDPSNAPCENPKANFCPAGYGAIQNGDWYEVISGTFVSTEAELVAAMATGGTVYLAKDITLTAPCTFSKNFTLIGNGNSVLSAKPVTVTAENATFENVGFADPTNANDNASSVYVYAPNKTVTFDGCSFEDNQWDAIQCTSKDMANITITNCTFALADSRTYCHRFIHIEPRNSGYIEVDAAVTITNNTFYADNSTCNDSLITMYGPRFANMTISGNTVIGNITLTNSYASGNIWISDGLSSTMWTASNGFAVSSATE